MRLRYSIGMSERNTEGAPSEADVRARIASLGFAWLVVAFVLVSVVGTVVALWPAVALAPVIGDLLSNRPLAGVMVLVLAAAFIAGREWLRLRRH